MNVSTEGSYTPMMQAGSTISMRLRETGADEDAIAVGDDVENIFEMQLEVLTSRLVSLTTAYYELERQDVPASVLQQGMCGVFELLQSLILV